MDKLNGRYNQIHDTILGLGMYLSLNKGWIHSGQVPMNSIYWSSGSTFIPTGIELKNFRFIEYEDSQNNRILPFKKQ